MWNCLRSAIGWRPRGGATDALPACDRISADSLEPSDSMCWICLERNCSSAGKLVQPCSCPRFVHEKCIARWQLQSAGRSCVPFSYRRAVSADCDTRQTKVTQSTCPALCREETQCRFCGRKLPDWKQKMTPDNVTPCATAVMAVVLNGKEHRITVEPGRNGRQQFEKEIRRLFSLSSDDELEFTFDCQTPGEGASLLQQAGRCGCSNWHIASCGRRARFDT